MKEEEEKILKLCRLIKKTLKDNPYIKDNINDMTATIDTVEVNMILIIKNRSSKNKSLEISMSIYNQLKKYYEFLLYKIQEYKDKGYLENQNENIVVLPQSKGRPPIFTNVIKKKIILKKSEPDCMKIEDTLLLN